MNEVYLRNQQEPANEQLENFTTLYPAPWLFLTALPPVEILRERITRKQSPDNPNKHLFLNFVTVH